MGSLGLLGRWLDDLADGARAVADLMSRRRRFRMRADGDRFAVVAVEGQTERAVGTVDGGGLTPVPSPAQLARLVEGQELEIVVPAGAVVVRALEPLPAESRSFIDGVVRHRLDRLVPWRPADVIYSAAVSDQPDGRLAVTVTASSRRVLAGALAAAAVLKPFRLRVVADGGGAAAIPVTIGRAEGAMQRNYRRAAAGVALAAAVLLVAEGGRAAFALMASSEEIAALDQQVADRRAVLRAAADAAARAAAPREDLLSLKQSSPVAAVVLEAVSRTLPDDAYLTDLTLDGGRLRLIGVSSRVAELVPMFEASEDFSGVAFFAPTVRIPDGGADRFSIEATVVPRTEIAP